MDRGGFTRGARSLAIVTVSPLLKLSTMDTDRARVEAALLDALEAGRLGGAGLDVFRDEPRVDPRFHALKTVVLQPHQGSGTHETRAAMGRLQRDNISAFLDGRALLTPVN